jgi:hypothetical protein
MNPRAGGWESGFCGILLLYVMEGGAVHARRPDLD